MTMPTNVKLNKDHAARLKKLGDKKAAVDQFVRTVCQQGENRMAEIQQEGRDIWLDVAKTYDLDLNKVNYDLSDDGETLVPVQVRL